MARAIFVLAVPPAVLAVVASSALVAVCPPAADASAAPWPTKPSAERGRWRWPVEGPVLSTFRYGRDPFARGQRRGIRIGASVGTPVRSACAGAVRFAGWAGTSGRVVSVVCGPWTTSYLHLAALSVRRGEAVGRGQRIGAVGRTGRPRLVASHLAFGARRTGRRWAYVDPLGLLPPLRGPPPPALVPAPRREPPGRPPALGPTPAAERKPSHGPLAVPARAFAPRPMPLAVPGHAARARGSAPSVPWTAWIGLAAVTAALVAWPIRGRRRRRSRPVGLEVAGARGRRA
jgi:Peptidase family M23